MWLVYQKLPFDNITSISLPSLVLGSNLLVGNIANWREKRLFPTTPTGRYDQETKRWAEMLCGASWKEGCLKGLPEMWGVHHCSFLLTGMWSSWRKLHQPSRTRWWEGRQLMRVEQKTKVWDPQTHKPSYQPSAGHFLSAFLMCKRNKLLSFVSHCYSEGPCCVHLILTLNNVRLLSLFPQHLGGLSHFVGVSRYVHISPPDWIC